MTEELTTKTYFSEDYLPMKKREFKKAGIQVRKDCKAYSKIMRGWGSRKKREAYNKQRFQEYHDITWDLQLDNLTFLYIISSYTDKEGFVKITINATTDDETGKITKYDIGNRERGWSSIKERAYETYLNTYKDCIEAKESVLENIKKEIEKRTPLIINLLKEKPRTRKIPAKVRYEVYMRDNGKCVICGSNINIEFDHIIPFSIGGSHNADNIQVLCQECNREKSDKINFKKGE